MYKIDERLSQAARPNTKNIDLKLIIKVKLYMKNKTLKLYSVIQILWTKLIAGLIKNIPTITPLNTIDKKYNNAFDQL
jgi:hypothetical protein